MNCPVCGAENAPGSKFCISCGTALSEAQAEPSTPASTPYCVDPPETTQAPASTTSQTNIREIMFQIGNKLNSIIKSLWNSKAVRLGVLCGALLLVVLMIVGSILASDNGFIPYEETIRCIASEDGVYSVIVGDKVLKTTIEGDISKPHRSSLDGKVAAFVTDDGELFVVTGDEVISVAQDVVSYKLSVNGSSIAYSVRGEDAEETSLYIAKVSNGKSTEICDNLGGTYAISPDGKSVAYYRNADEDPSELMLYKNKKSSYICNDETYLYGLSNGGKQIYVRIEDDGDEILCAFTPKGEKKKLGEVDGNIRFNSDHTQVLFEDEDGKSYISTKAKPAVKVSTDSLDLVIAPGSAAMDVTYPVANLYNHVYSTDDREALLIQKKESVKLISKASHIQLDGSAEYLYYCYNSKEVRYIKISQGEKASENAKTILDEFVNFAISADRKYVYYQDGSDTLMCIDARKGGNPKEISDEVDFNSGLAINNKHTAYYIVDDDLYAVSNGKKGSKVLSDVDYVTSSPNGYVFASGDDSIYITTGSKKLKKLLTLDF